MPASRLACGVIGLGRMGQRHAETLAGRLPEAQLVEVAVALRNSQQAGQPVAVNSAR
jgi:scyllo-inositol 2-dehydrogenase (NAD+)